MQKIPLHGKHGKGKHTLVSDEDFDRLNRHKWHVLNYRPRRDLVYVIRYEDNKRVFMHREIIGTPKGMVTDHINRDTLDNRRCNLRVATHAQNKRNVSKKTMNGKQPSSRFKGVCFDKRLNKWRAQISIKNKITLLGRFKSEIKAAKAYDAAAQENYGDFACLNFPA